MPVLDWIGKEAVVNHDKEVPFKLLKKIKDSSLGKSSQNLVIHGDNLEALKALLPFYFKRIKCIYIDPPYNIGTENWVYNDKVDSPKIRQWLGKVVGSRSEDLCRDDKWLSMMYPRLKLLRELLSDDGAIFISIDDNEFHNLRLLMNEIFLEKNFVASFIWESRSGKGATAKKVVSLHEYVLCFAKDYEHLKMKEDLRVSQGGNRKDEKGFYRREQLRQWGQGDRREDRKTMFYPVETPEGTEAYPIKDDGTEGRWRVSEKKMKSLIDSNEVDFEFDGEQWQLYRKIRSGRVTKTAMGSFLFGLGTASNGTIELKELFGQKVFDTAKPVELIKYIISLLEDKNAIILDSFAGSGTTGQAVMQLNSEDKGNRKFILIQLEEDIKSTSVAYTAGYRQVVEITKDRQIKAINKFGYKEGFEFCELDEPLFDENGDIHGTCTFTQLASYIYFTETKTNIDVMRIHQNYIGEFGDSEYYLLFKERGKNTLTKAFLKELNQNLNHKIIYADKCFVDEDSLKGLNAEFKQIPYEVKSY